MALSFSMGCTPPWRVPRSYSGVVVVATLTDVAGRHVDEALQEVPQGAVFR